MLDYLLHLKGGLAELLDAEVAVMEDEEGWGVMGMAIEASCGRQDKEEAVRAIVDRWGVSAGPRHGRDKSELLAVPCLSWITEPTKVAGWSPLHLAALLSSPPLVSFLLTRGASADAPTNRGLTPLDLVADMAGREDVAILLLGASDEAEDARMTDSASDELSVGRKAILQKRRERVKMQALQEQTRDKQETVTMRRENWIRDVVRPAGVDVSLLVEPPSRRRRDGYLDTAVADDGIEEEDEGLGSDNVSLHSARSKSHRRNPG